MSSLGEVGIPGDKFAELPFDSTSAAANSSDLVVWTAPYNVRVKRVEVVFNASVAGANTNSMTIEARTSVGGAGTELEQIAFTANVNATAGRAEQIYDSRDGAGMSRSYFGRDIDTDDPIALRRVKVGNGLATPAGTCRVTYTSR